MDLYYYNCDRYSLSSLMAGATSPKQEHLYKEPEKMNLKSYFETTKGYGVLSTSDAAGVVNAAIYSRPHVMEDGTLAIIMNRKLSYKNVSENPKAHYLYLEDGPGYKGKRLSLTKLREEENTERLFELCRRCYPSELEPKEKVKLLVYFSIDKELPLVGI